MNVSRSCSLHGRCALGFMRTLSPELGSAGHTWSRAQTQIFMRGTGMWVYALFFGVLPGLGRPVDATDERALRGGTDNARHLL